MVGCKYYMLGIAKTILEILRQKVNKINKLNNNKRVKLSKQEKLAKLEVKKIKIEESLTIRT